MAYIQVDAQIVYKKTAKIVDIIIDYQKQDYEKEVKRLMNESIGVFRKKRRTREEVEDMFGKIRTYPEYFFYCSQLKRNLGLMANQLQHAKELNKLAEFCINNSEFKVVTLSEKDIALFEHFEV